MSNNKLTALQITYCLRCPQIYSFFNLLGIVIYFNCHSQQIHAIVCQGTVRWAIGLLWQLLATKAFGFTNHCYLSCMRVWLTIPTWFEGNVSCIEIIFKWAESWAEQSKMKNFLLIWWLGSLIKRFYKQFSSARGKTVTYFACAVTLHVFCTNAFIIFTMNAIDILWWIYPSKLYANVITS